MKQMVSQPKQEENKGRSVAKSDSTCRNDTTSTGEVRKIHHQENCEALQPSSKKSEEDQDNNYEE
jgi:hypothetical protein